MGTTDPRRIVLAVLAAAALAAAGVIAWGLRPQPQLAAGEEVFRTVDALYTAVRNRDPGQLARCETKLAAYADEGKMSARAGKFLAGVIAEAKGGGWDSAAERLYAFMRAQRR